MLSGVRYCPFCSHIVGEIPLSSERDSLLQQIPLQVIDSIPIQVDGYSVYECTNLGCRAIFAIFVKDTIMLTIILQKPS